MITTCFCDIIYMYVVVKYNNEKLLIYGDHMEKYEEIKKKFETIQNKENAIIMSKYMRNMFSFYGIQTPERKNVYKELLKNEKKNKEIDWEFLDKCFNDSHREFQYLVSDYLIAMKKYVKYEDIPKIKEYIITKSWWDTTDALFKPIGELSLEDKRVKSLMIKWSKDSNIWIRRTAIEFQLNLKENTDVDLLEKIIINNFGKDEFFINKAIGWALREYSKTDSNWVRNFIESNKEKMSKLSIKEGSKYI